MKSVDLKKRLAALLVVLCLAVCSAVPALATSANISLNRTGSLKVTLYDHQNDLPLHGGRMTLYKVADIQRKNGDLSYVYTGSFAGCTIELGDLSSSTLASSLQKLLPTTAQGIEEKISESGEVTFENLPLGLYLAVQTEASKGYEAINSFLVSIPLKDGNNWIYDVDASPKVGATVPTTPDEPDNPPDKPDKPDKPDNPPDTPDTPDNPDTPVTPDNPDNPVKPGQPDNPVAPGTPDNPVAPGNPDNPVLPGHPDNPVLSGLPQTGQLNWPIPVMACGGVVLFAIGWALTQDRRPRHE